MEFDGSLESGFPPEVKFQSRGKILRFILNRGLLSIDTILQ